MSNRSLIWVLTLLLSTWTILCLAPVIAQTQRQQPGKQSQAEMMSRVEGIGGVEVGIRKKPIPQIVARTKTDKSGKFRFDNLGAGTYAVVVYTSVLTNPMYKSFFESRSNMLSIEIIVGEPEKSHGTNPLVVEWVLKGGRAIRVIPEGSNNTRQAQTEEKENEVTIEVAEGQSVSGRITSKVRGGGGQ